MKFENQLRYATTVLTNYEGGSPLHHWLKGFFRENPQMGSRDRRLVSSLVYGFFRLGHAGKDRPRGERILGGLFLSNDQPSDWLGYFRPEWNEKIHLPLEQKIAFFQAQPEGAGFLVADIFPWKDQLSKGIDHEAFCLSFLRQPDLFLRIRPGHIATALGKLEAAGYTPATSGTPLATPLPSGSAPRTYEFIPPFTLRLPNGFKVEDHFIPDREVVIQDYSSQRLADFLQPPSIPPANEASDPFFNAPTSGTQPSPPPVAPPSPTRRDHDTPPFAPQSFWDACSASGGKSILAHDLYPQITITVSDIRDSILHNLHQRFKQAGITDYQAFLVDLTRDLPPGFPGNFLTSAATSQASPGASISTSAATFPFDLILADVPCSGSGTWSRTPEECWFFDPKKLKRYNMSQRAIVSHIAPFLAKGARLVYSTCSVFASENEEITTLIQGEFNLQPEKMENIKGYELKADSMFAAGFHR